MKAREFCEECESIAMELREAFASAWEASDEDTKDAWIAMRNLLGGTEEDAQRAEDLAAKARLLEPQRIKQALQRKFAHEVLTGHKVK